MYARLHGDDEQTPFLTLNQAGNSTAPRGASQAGAPRPVAWFHFFDKMERRHWRAFRRGAGYAGSQVVPQARKACLMMNTYAQVLLCMLVLAALRLSLRMAAAMCGAANRLCVRWATHTFQHRCPGLDYQILVLDNLVSEGGWDQVSCLSRAWPSRRMSGQKMTHGWTVTVAARLLLTGPC